MKIIDLAYYTIDNYDDVTPMKLQKLLFYLKVWGLISKENLISEPFVRWDYGPVNTEIYYKFKSDDKEKNKKPLLSGKKPYEIEIGKKELIDFILDSYAQFDAYTLSNMTHYEKPWTETENDQVISDQSIINYYSTLYFAKNFPLVKGSTYYLPKSNMHFSFILDMDEESADKASTYSSFEKWKTDKTTAESNLSDSLKMIFG